MDEANRKSDDMVSIEQTDWFGNLKFAHLECNTGGKSHSHALLPRGQFRDAFKVRFHRRVEDHVTALDCICEGNHTAAIMMVVLAVFSSPPAFLICCTRSRRAAGTSLLESSLKEMEADMVG